MNDEKYVVINDIMTAYGPIKSGSVITITHGFVYFNGGMVSTAYQKLIGDIVYNEEKNGFKNLRKEKKIKNKV